MKIGVVFPQLEIESDASAIREYATSVEAMGFNHVLAYDHVLGANTANRPDWQGTTLESAFQEPLVLFSYMAGVTSTIGFFTGVLIVTQRQTALVAKQAACLDVFCGGRLRLGIGTGWNRVEYQSLGVPFEGRGARMEQQIEVLRALWTQESVTFDTALHKIPDAGINPLPIQRPIPIWIGGGSKMWDWNQPGKTHVIRRIARLADGWVPMWEPGPSAEETLEHFRDYCREYGRNPSKIGLEGRYDIRQSNQDNWAEGLAAWRKIGATHVSINTMGDGLQGVEQHLRRLEEVRTLLAQG